MATWLDQPIFGSISPLDILLFILIISAAMIISRVFASLIRKYLDDTVGKRSSKRVANLLKYSIMTVAFLVGTATFLHVDLNAAIISLGIVGVAVAFATQQIIQNAVAGLLISITKPIELEDWVEVGSTPSTGICRVKDIRLMSTELRENGGRIAIIPNSQIINGKVINYTKSGFTALEKSIWVGPMTDLSVVRRIVLEEADKDPCILPVVSDCDGPHLPTLFEHTLLTVRPEEEPEVLASLNPIVNVVDIQGSRVKLQIKVWVRDAQKSEEIMSRLLQSLKARFETEGIELRDP